ncbi:MAG: DUF3175 domain-containing protein [Pseudoxanthomonas sp.]
MAQFAHAPSHQLQQSSDSEKWSQAEGSQEEDEGVNADVFQSEDPASIAKLLKRTAERTHKKRTTPYRSAMSMLVFYINRSGRNLPARQLKVLEDAKEELRVLFDKPRKGDKA